MIRVVVVDDHPVVREGLVSLLGDQGDFEVVAAAGAVGEAVPVVERHRPDVVLLDLELPEGDGVAAISRFEAASPRTSVVVFTAYETDERVLGAIQAGARGYLLKGAAGDEIARAIRAVAEGGTYLQPRVAGRLASAIRTPSHDASPISDREREVLRLIADGQSTKQVARTLSISERTVKFHVASIRNKLGAGTRAQAVALATQRGLI